MKILTLAVFVRENEVLLAMKKRGFGAGNWNGYGGKLQEGETVTLATIREVKEESSVDIKAEDLEELGALDFYFDDKPEWNQSVIIYRVAKWEGEPIETEEMKPKWFAFDEIPFSNMWKDDSYWYPYFLRGEKFSGEIHFCDEGKNIASAFVNKKE